MENNYYTYLYKLPCGTPYYVGSGTASRALAPHTRKKHDDIILPPTGGRTLHFVEFDISEDESEELEQFLISELGRKDIGTGILENLTDGGKFGRSGYKVLPETVEAQAEKVRQAHKDGKYPKEKFGGINGGVLRMKTPEGARAHGETQRGRLAVTDTRTGETYKVDSKEYWSNPPAYLVPAGTGISKKAGFVTCYDLLTGESTKVSSKEFNESDNLVGVTSVKAREHKIQNKD